MSDLKNTKVLGEAPFKVETHIMNGTRDVKIEASDLMNAAMTTTTGNLTKLNIEIHLNLILSAVIDVTIRTQQSLRRTITLKEAKNQINKINQNA